MNKILELKFGSHLYGTSTPESDLDFKAIYLPTAREIVLGSYKKTINTSRKKKPCERNTKDDIDVEVISLDRFLELLCEGQTIALDILFHPEFCVVDDIWDQQIFQAIFDNKERLLTRNVNAFVGYARQQAAKYGIKGSRMDALKRAMELLDQLPLYDKLVDHAPKLAALVVATQELVSLEKYPLVEIIDIQGPKAGLMEPHLHVCGRKIPFHARVKTAKETYGKILANYGQRATKAHLEGGVDWKALSHAVRVNAEAMELLQTGKITFPCPNREFLLQIKTGQLPYEEVAGMIEQGLADLTAAHAVSKLRDEPDYDWVKDLTYRVYSEIVKAGE
jgi:RNA repair pathway DNA polymerase beta family